MSLAQVAEGGQSTLQIVLAVAGSGAVAALISGFFARRKTIAEAGRTGADATASMATASATQVKSLLDQLDALRADRDEDEARNDAQLTELRERMSTVERQATEDRTARWELIQWARAVIEILKQAKITFPQPPAGVSDSGGHPRYRPPGG